MTSPLLPWRTALAILGLCAATRLAAAQPTMAGNWTLDAARSTNLGGWQTFDLSIELDHSHLKISRHVVSEGRDTLSVIPLDLSLPVNRVEIPWWIDNRHIGAYSGGDKIALMHTRWLDNGRVLRTDADLTLATQQGEHPVNIVTDYKLSTDGKLLTVLELRSTRDLPIIYVFHRAS
jgi:hypothetical protein